MRSHLRREGKVDRDGPRVLIGDRHRDLYREYYSIRLLQPAARPSRWLDRIESYADEYDVTTILDYGSGASRCVSRFSRFNVVDYDPGVPGIDALPDRRDMVVCIHALEHVEEDRVRDVLAHILSLAAKVAFVVASCEHSTKTLPDGSPWHSFVRSPEWWSAELLSRGFKAVSVRPGMESKEFAAIRVTS